MAKYFRLTTSGHTDKQCLNMNVRTPFTELRIWKQAHKLALEIYSISNKFPVEEKFGLQSQIRRSVSSVSANIAEASGRETRKDIARFLTISRGSVQETISHCLLAKDLGIIDESEANLIINKYNILAAGIHKYKYVVMNR